MKIFLISNMYPSKNDNLFGIFIKNLKEELESQGISFTAMSLIKGKSYSTSKKLSKYLIHFISIFKNYFINDYEIIYTHYFSHHLPILFTLLPFKNKPWIINAHGNDFKSLERNKFYKRIAIIVLKKVELIIVPSYHFKNVILGNYPFLSENDIFISPSGGINPKLFYKEKDKSQKSTLSLGFVSRLIEQKGWITFLNALIILQQKGIPFKATIAGKGPDEEQIKSYIKRNNLSNVNFVGFIKQNNLVKLYNEFDIYIFPTYNDSLGLTGLEAMACGTPVVASNIEGPSTYIEDRVNGYLFNVNDPNHLAIKIIDYIKLTQAQKLRLTAKALDTAEAYNRSVVTKELLTEMKKLIKV